MNIPLSTQVDWSRLYTDEDSRVMVRDAYEATEKTESWKYLQNFEPQNGFMFTDNPIINKISSNLKYDGHSGCSYGWTMRQIQHIAIHGVKYD
jgi:hypothetical protein